MFGDDLRHIRSLASQYRVALLIAAAVVAFASLASRHINNSEEATHALGHIYGNAPHFEWRLTEIPHPTR